MGSSNNLIWTDDMITPKIICISVFLLNSVNTMLYYESSEGSFEIRDSLSEIRDSKFNILINQWEEK
jgi:hypothetical protein